MEKYSIEVSQKLNGFRLDHALAELIPGMSRRRAKAIIDTGGVFVNRKRIRVASRTVSKSDAIEVSYNAELFTTQRKEELSLRPEDLLFQNADVIVINKPAGLPSQATRDQSILHVIPVLQKLLLSLGQTPPDLQLVHRLDKDTTGCLVVAKSKAMMTFLTDQFREKTLSKNYHALVWGKVKASFEEKCYLSAIQANSGRVKAMNSGGKHSHTKFQVLEVFPKLSLSLLNCEPITGRSHQIRVHLEKNQHSIIGDKVYGEASLLKLPEELQSAAKHQLLHAHSIAFQLPGQPEPVTVVAPYPATFARFLELARQN